MHKLYCAKTCKTWEHLEGNICVSDTKQVACDKTGINASNGSLSSNQVTITRSNGKWSNPAKCTLTCNTGYEKITNPLSCKKSPSTENPWTPPAARKSAVLVTCPIRPTGISFKSRGQVRTYELKTYRIFDTYYVIVDEEIDPSEVEITTTEGKRFGVVNRGDIFLDEVRDTLRITEYDTIWAYRCDLHNKL